MTHILQDILKLSVAERILMVETIWNSIASQEKDVELTKETKKLLDERLVAHKQNPKEGSDWEKAKARIRKQL